ncbi:hypothetical protein RBWH47_05060 [Rhodopirellula baltica WH47]|uniref:Uncharacterized protein n=1 Tax=Rhodopirellula baltica WH47 TaxID=991778 RepID=F2AN32_RHOBT|nr:hypothetical protein RBWH47_05060 [Rhodopirellula baltica WH47]
MSEGKKRATVWKRLCSHLEKVGVPEARIEELRESDDPAAVAALLEKIAK